MSEQQNEESEWEDFDYDATDEELWNLGLMTRGAVIFGRQRCKELEQLIKDAWHHGFRTNIKETHGLCKSKYEFKKFMERAGINTNENKKEKRSDKHV